ncbi:CBS domain-containing protein [Haloparvum alkalitolerans]|uniref:CBS domain-containing protein n=1 Tax=Haloparvum alkalitolerans TaxID=1042953 RepID=UPI003CF44179
MQDGTTVRDVMHRAFLGVSESDTLGDAAELMLAEGADCLVVVRGGEPVGCLSPRDALGAILDGADPGETTVDEVMAPPAPTVPADSRIAAAEERLVAEGSSRLVVTRDGEAVGILTERDVLAAGTTHPSAGAEHAVRGSAADVGAAEEAAVDAESADAPTAEATQSICEVCGTLTAELSPSNGQMLCPDCQEV